jgi:hypothetical protein
VDVVGSEDVSQLKGLPRSVYELAPGAFWSHWQAYVGVPPPNETVVVRVELWPASTTPGLAPIVGAASAGLTVTVTGAELTVTGVSELSVARSRKRHVPTVDSRPVEIEGREEVLQPK